MKKSILFSIALLGLVACGRSTPSEVPINEDSSRFKETLIQTAPAPEIEPFTASLSAPKHIKSQEEFSVEASLKNLTENSFRIQHAAHVFYFSIKDSSGRTVNTFVMPDVGIVHVIQNKESITEKYTYKLEKPGLYSVTATAKFTIGEGDNMKDYELTTNKEFLEVVQ